MMNKIERTDYLVNEVIFEKSAEQSISCNITLPEYCGDISKVLRCTLRPNVTSSSLSGDRIENKGEALISLMYLSDGKIFSYEQREPFSYSADINCETIGAVLETRSAIQYVNCRAVSSRTAEVNAVFVITNKLTACKSRNVVKSINDESMQIKGETVLACSASGNSAADVSVNRVIDIGNQKPQIKSIIKNTAVPVISQSKQVNGKVLVKGELEVNTLYKTEEDLLECAQNALPFSQIFDTPGVDEESTVDIMPYLSLLDIQAKPNALGAMTLLDISAVISMEVSAYNCIEFPVVTDAYSTEYDAECTFRKVSVDKIVRSLSETYVHTFEIKNDASGSRVADMWCEDIKCKADYNGSEIVFTGSLNAFALMQDDDKNVSLNRGETQFSFSEKIGTAEHMRALPQAVIIGADYTMGENEINVRVRIKIDAVIFDNYVAEVIDDVKLSEEPLEKPSALFVYYPQENESLWNIAGKFKTTTEKIAADNGLKSSDSTSSPLLIWSK